MMLLAGLALMALFAVLNFHSEIRLIMSCVRHKDSELMFLWQVSLFIIYCSDKRQNKKVCDISVL